MDTYIKATSKPRPIRDWYSLRWVYTTMSRAQMAVAQVSFMMWVKSMVQGVRDSAMNLKISNSVHVAATNDRAMLVASHLDGGLVIRDIWMMVCWLEHWRLTQTQLLEPCHRFLVHRSV